MSATRKGWRRLTSVSLAALAVGLSALVSGEVYGSMWGNAQNAGNRLAAGNVTLTDNDSGGALLSLNRAALGASDAGCIKVSYAGSLPSHVRLHGTVSGDLAPYLRLKVTRGSGVDNFKSCSGFTADATKFIGAGPGVMYDGKLSDYPGSWSAGIVDGDGTGGGSPSYYSNVSSTPGVLGYWRLADGAVSADEFTGADGTTLTSHTSGFAANWTSTGEAQTAVLTNENRIRKTPGTGAAMYYPSGTPASANYRVEADVHVKSLLATDAVAVIGRYNSATNSMYLARYDVSGGTWDLMRILNGSATFIGTRYAQALSPGQTHRLTLDMNGSTIRLLVDGVQRISVTDTNLSATGRGGVRLGASNTTAAVSNSAGLHLDNFAITTAATTASDAKGTNNGTIANGPALNQAGALSTDPDRAMRFDGVDDHVRVARQVQDDLSIELWFKSTQGIGTGTHWWSGAGLVDAEVGGAAADFGVSLRSDGRVMAGVGTPDVTIRSAPGFNDGGWHHVVFTRTRSTGAMQLYVDGELEGSATGSTAALTASANFDFGRIQTAVNYFAGSLDEVAIYDTALSQDVVRSHFGSLDQWEAATWVTSEEHSYKFEIIVGNDEAAYGKSATATFNWEARNL